MTDREIMQYIDDGANYYISLFGDAIHMEKVEKEFYTYIKPKAGEKGISFIYNVHMDGLPTEQIKMLIEEMKSMHMPIWLSLLVSNEVAFLFSGKEPTHVQTEHDENDEIYMAMLPEEQKEYRGNNHKIIRVNSAGEFALWAQTVNNIFSDGYPDIHPVNHFIWCEKRGVKCYILYHDNIPVSVAAIMNHNGVASLEFVGTIPEMRKRGLAKAVCEKAVYDAFSDGASILTIRAVNTEVARLYQSIGFKAYN